MTQLAAAARAVTRLEVVEDVHAYLAVAPEIDVLAVLCGAPVTARSAWTAASLDALPSSRPLVVLLRDDAGVLEAAAVLLVSPGPDTEVITSPGGPDHRAALVAINDDAAARLGTAVADVLSARPRRARLSLGAFPVGDRAVEALAAGLPGAATLWVDPIPCVVRRTSTAVEDYLSKNTRRGIRRGRQRLDEDGRTVELTVTSDIAEIVGLLPALEQTCRERDHVQGRASELDDSTGLNLWRRRCGRVIAQEHVELAVLRIDGALAAYVLGVVDGRTYRVLEGRLVTTYDRYSPGRILESGVLARVLADPALDSLDWMTSIASDRLLATNSADPVVVVLADIVPSRAVRRAAATA